MALTPPDDAYVREALILEDLELPELFEAIVQQAADLFQLASGIDDDSKIPDGFPHRIAWNGMAAMYGYLMAHRDDEDQTFGSNLSSERLGSYYYSRVAQRIASDPTSTGVLWFDLAVRYFLSGGADAEALSLISSIQVFGTEGDVALGQVEGDIDELFVLGPRQTQHVFWKPPQV